MQLIINKLSTIVSAYQKKILSEQHGNKLKVILSVKSKDKCHQLLFYCFFFSDCSALELAISMNNVWALTSTGRIQCYENISRDRPMGTNSRFLPGTFLSIAG